MDERVKGTAMGLLGAAIGVLPLGALVNGAAAEAVGARAAIGSAALTGIAFVAVLVRHLPATVALP